MKMWNSEEEVKKIHDRLSKYNTKVIKKIASRIREIGEITPSDVHRLNMLAEANIDIAELEKELREILGISIEEAEQIYKKTAQNNIDFAEKYYKYRGKEIPKIKDMNSIITGMTIVTNNMINNSNIMGFSTKMENKTIYKSFKQTYIDTINKAIQQTALGLENYQTAMRETIIELADSGVRRIEYASGYSQRLDSAVRRDILDGVRIVEQQVQEQIGEDIGADGYEISIHDACAPDHLDIQGKQYNIEEYKALNESLVRPIGHLNCRHIAFPVILGVNEPVYSKKELKKIKEHNKKQYEYEGEKYTIYEGTQVQRRLETEIRKKKDEYIGLKELGEKEDMAITMNKINQLRVKYIDFSKKMNIKTKANRLSVKGYG